MIEKTFNTRIQSLRDTEANWIANEFTPLEGEIVVYSTDENHAAPR